MNLQVRQQKIASCAQQTVESRNSEKTMDGVVRLFLFCFYLLPNDAQVQIVQRRSAFFGQQRQ